MSATDTNRNPAFLFVDLFAGAGGTSTGAEQSGVCRVIAAVNHDPVAISSHTANHPQVAHFIEDIRTFNADLIKPIVHRHPYPSRIKNATPCIHTS